ncbi:MAG: OmpA family protein [Flavobacteriaceae bacterium]|nr:OmpA family protein [Flavobacteriaceae bacterium]
MSKIGTAQEVTVSLGGGLQGVHHQGDQVNGDIKVGGGLGIGYTYFISKEWGMATGVGLDMYRTNLGIGDNRVIRSFEVDDTTSAFEYRVIPTGYSEEQRLYSLSVPIMLTYKSQHSGSGKVGFYARAGSKIVFPLRQNIDVRAERLELRGYYPDLNLEIDDLPNHGFGTLTDLSGESQNELSTVVLTASIETGLYFKLKPTMDLYTGLYVDYGLSDLRDKDRNSNIVGYGPTGTNDISAKGGMANNDLMDKSRLMALGLKVRVGFSLNKTQEVPQPEDRPILTDTKEPVEDVIDEPAPPKEVVTSEEKMAVPTLTDKEVETITSPMAFDTIDNVSITPQLAKRLDRVAQILLDNDSVHVIMKGYTCNLGSEQVNQRVGRQRAQSVADYLRAKGVDANRMEVISMGESSPVVPNTSSENRRKNRRVSISIDKEANR